MDGTIQEYTLEMGADTKANVLEVKQCDTNSRKARIKLVAFDKPWIIPFGCQIHINVRKTDGTLANAVCARVDESTVMAPITEQMTTVTGTQLGELYFLGSDGDIKSQTFPIVVRPMIMDQARMESSDDFQSLQGALRQVETSTEMADAATQYATAQGDQARDAAQRAEDAAASIQVAVDAAANAKACESNAKNSELAAVQTQQEVTDYVEAQKAAFVGYSQRESDSKYANALTATTTGEGGVTVEDAWTAPVLGLEVAGKSEQATTTGAQLLDLEQWLIDRKASYTKEDSTFTIDSISPLHSLFKFSKADIQVTMSGTIESTDNATHARFELLDINGSKVAEFNGGTNPITATASQIQINYNNNSRTKLINIMLNTGTTALPFEPYTGGAPSPSPDYPQDIISVGTVSTGKQLIDASRIPSKTAGGATLTNNGDGSFTITGNGELSANFSTYYTLTHEESQHIFPPGKYSISTKSTPVTYINFKNTDGIVASLTYKSGTKEITEEMVNDDGYYVNIGFMGETGQAITPKTIFPMLNAGDTALPWEPYTGGKPSPSVEYPAVVEVTATGGESV